MTNAIEVTKREMYRFIAHCHAAMGAGQMPQASLPMLESALEAHLEQLRQQYEAMSLTARERFDSIQTLEAANELAAAQLAKAKSEIETLTMRNQTQRQIIEEAGGTNELRHQLAAMKQERDDIQGRLHAVDHKFFARDQALKLAGEELRAKSDQIGHLTRTRDVAERLAAYRQKELDKALQWLARMRKTESSTSAQVSPEVVYGAEMDASTATIIGAVGAVQRVLADWSRDDLRAKAAMRLVGKAINGDSAVLLALKSFEEPEDFPVSHPVQCACTGCGTQPVQ